MAKLGIIKVTADGEQVSIEIDPNSLDMSKPLREQCEPYFKLMDDRLWEINKRVIAANYMSKKLPAEAQMAMANIIDILHGRKPGPELETVVSQAAEAMQKERDELAEEAKKAGESKITKIKKPHVGNA